MDQPSHADAGREFTAFEISGTTDKQIIKETRKKTAVWVCLRCMPYPGRGAVKMYCIIYNYGKMLLFPIIYGNVICAVWRRRMDNISFYHRNRKKQVWKAGQSERLPGFSGCRFLLVYADNCQLRAPPFRCFLETFLQAGIYKLFFSGTGEQKFIDGSVKTSGGNWIIMRKKGKRCMRKRSKQDEKPECARTLESGHIPSPFQKKQAHI